MHLSRSQAWEATTGLHGGGAMTDCYDTKEPYKRTSEDQRVLVQIFAKHRDSCYLGVISIEWTTGPGISAEALPLAQSSKPAR